MMSLESIYEPIGICVAQTSHFNDVIDGYDRPLIEIFQELIGRTGRTRHVSRNNIAMILSQLDNIASSDRGFLRHFAYSS
jgi:hypothetical protein